MAAHRGGLKEVLIPEETKKDLTEIPEKITKELLEKNNRREGPLFKGDESLIWQHKEFQNSELAPLSLSVLINDNWLRKGLNAHYITLKAYTVLQKAHLKNRYERINRPRYFHIFPNELKNNIYTDSLENLAYYSMKRDK